MTPGTAKWIPTPRIRWKSGTVGVFLPRKNQREPWRLPRLYARQLRDMEMASFINRANDIRLKFTPDEREPFPKAPPLPGTALGIDQQRTEGGVRIFGGKRTKTRCLRPVSYSQSQCYDNNSGMR